MNSPTPFIHRWSQPLTCILHFVCFALAVVFANAAEPLDRTAKMWTPHIEWPIKNPSHDGNPFDLIATATFVHLESGEERATGMFYDGDATWKFRFTGTRPGEWIFKTSSPDADLNGKTGKVVVEPNPDPAARGFLGHDGNRWSYSAQEDWFTPQIVMCRSASGCFNQTGAIDDDLRLWFDDHGFNGLHTYAGCGWFDLNATESDDLDEDPNPDPRTFEALEDLITRAYAAGGMVHIWAWGDESRRQTPVRWGINGKVDKRLQRYIAARLGPLPGWSMGYGFDLWEWVDGDQLEEWRDFMSEQMGWPHLLGGRVHRHGTPITEVMTSSLDYAGYETHRPDYATYLDAMRRNPNRPVFMEDRFRVRDNRTYREKDYTLELTRRGLWHSTMAGGVANIWGYLLPDAGPDGMSRPYPNKEMIKTWARFCDGRLLSTLAVAEGLGDGIMALRSNDGRQHLLYQEAIDKMEIDLTGMPSAQPAVAIDTAGAYQPIKLGTLHPGRRTIEFPSESDWAVAIGEFWGE